MRSLSLVAPLLVLGLSLAACGDVRGVAQPAETMASVPDSGGASGSGRPSRSSTSKPTGSAPSGIDVCDLLSAADRAQLGLEPGKPTTIGRSKACDWDADRWGMTVGFKTDLAFKDADLRGATATPVNIGRHEAHRVENAGGGDGGCEVFIVTGESSFVQVTTGTSSGSNTPFACEKAVAVAKIIDPKLP